MNRTVMALVAVIIILVAALAWTIGKTQGRPSSSESSEIEQVIAESKNNNGAAVAAEATNQPGMTAEPTKAQSSDEGAASPLIDGCYRLESCSFSKIANQKTVGRRNGERLVQANLIHSETFNAPTGFKGPKRNEMVWEKHSQRVYAICSQERPILVFNSGTAWTAEEFDFTMIPGVSQNAANIYQALCHGKFLNEVANEPDSFGYHPLNDGGRGQFNVSSPQSLFAEK